MRIEYIHYGSNAFDKGLIQIPKMTMESKPDMGLWGSRVNDNNGWENWCLSEDYCVQDLDRHFKFTLSEDANILECHSDYDILPYVIRTAATAHLNNIVSAMNPSSLTTPLDRLDTVKLYKDYDGIEVFLDTNFMWCSIFNSWDCNSICVWNADVINA